MRWPTIVFSIVAASGCSAYGSTLLNNNATQTEAESCSRKIGEGGFSHGDELNSQDIRVVNWNIQKGSSSQWAVDLEALQGNSDLMLLQEAALNAHNQGRIGGYQYQSFAPGFRTWRSVTGVMTSSATRPLTQCNLVSLEPWLGTPKATIITEYGLTDTDETLLVVNMHAVNFAFGTRDFEEQMQQARIVMDQHIGPLLLSGDFNTWSGRRSALLSSMATDLNLEVLDYDEDYRARFFGLPLDHIYVRGLVVLEATTHRVDSSDHNPMSVRLRL